MSFKSLNFSLCLPFFLVFPLGIRDHIISKSMCVCGATNILADDLLPNKTLRDTINRILESSNNSAENGGSAFQAQGLYLVLSVLLIRNPPTPPPIF